MKIHELTITTTPGRKRVGRGTGSGMGKTSGRGTKGQNSRTGGGVRPGFEGGQNPLAKRLPKKRGFTSINRIEFQIINLSDLERLVTGELVDLVALRNAGLIGSTRRPVKLLGNGQVSHKVHLQIQAASQTAAAAIEQAGGRVELVALPKMVPTPRQETS